MICFCFTDGANVAYYGDGRIHYSSLKVVVETLVGMGENPLVVMPSKYVQQAFYINSKNAWQNLSERDIEVIEW